MDAEKVTVQQLAEALDRWAPWAGAESWDNVGVLAGADAPFSAVLCALDITPSTGSGQMAQNMWMKMLCPLQSSV